MGKTLRFLAAAATPVLLLCAASAFAQIQEWIVAPVATNGVPIVAGFTPSLTPRHVAAVDANGNLFIAGQFPVSVGANPEGRGQFLGKYSSGSGTEQWRFTGPVPSNFRAVAVNAAGDAFVVGYYVTNTIEQNYVARISGATGAVMWEVRGFPADSTENYALDVVLDPSGNPVVLAGQGRRAVVTKYDASSGALQWSSVAAADLPATQNPFGIERDPDGNFVGVTYYGDGSPGNPSASLLFKLDGTTGARLWATPWTYRDPQIQGLTLDGAGKPIIAGPGIAKFSNVDGSLIWERTLSGDSTPSVAYDVATASNGDVFATGTEGSQGQTPLTARLRSLDGATIWSSAEANNDTTKPNQYGKSIAVDGNGNLVVSERLYPTNAPDYEIDTRTFTSDGVLTFSGLYAPTGVESGLIDADLSLSALNAAYTLAHYTRRSDGATVTVAIKYSEPGKPFPSVALTASPNPADLGQPVTLSAAVSGNNGAPTGTVDFHETTSGVTPIAACRDVPLVNGMASCNAGAFAPGTHRFEAIYSGDAVYEPSAGNTTETVRNNQATVSLASSANPSSFGQQVTFTASVSGSAGTPTGTVRFMDGNTSGSDIYGCSPVALSGASATCTLNGLMPGTHAISASYSGDSSYDPATSSALNETIEGSIQASPVVWQTTTTDTPEPFLDTTVNAGAVGRRGGVDTSGNLFVVATTLSQPTVSQSRSCLVVIKYAASTGAVAWRRDNCTPDLSSFGASLGVDADGNVLVTGAVNGLYVAKLSGATGSPIWERTIGGARGMGLGLDAAGDARVLGWDGSGITIHGIANADGSVQWQTALDTVRGGKALSFAVDAAGDSAVYDRHTIDSHDNVEDAITRLDASGHLTWRVVDPGGEFGLVMDAQGDVIGSSLGGLVKRDAASGAVLWSQPFGGLARLDAQGNIYVASSASTGIDGHTDAFFAKIDASGNVVWTRLLVDPNSTLFMGAADLDTDGNLVAVGEGAGAGQSVRQTTFKISAADGTLLWMAQLQDLGASEDPAGVFGVPQGVLTFGWLIGSGGSDQGLYAALYSHDAGASGTGTLMLDATTVDFGSQSMGTTSPPHAVTVTNTSAATVDVTGVSVSGPFAQTNHCGTLAPNASCVIDVTFSPPVTSGDLNSTSSASGTLTVSHDGAGSQATATLSGTGEKSLVAHYYWSILRRAPDAGGHDFWQGEAARVVSLGANVNEAWYAMAATFFASAEYAGLARDDGGYLTDLYETFFNRAPDDGGFAYWMDQMSSGMPRDTVLLQFLFSPEFASFTQGVFGDTAARPEVDMTMDFYRGVLARLPDADGFAYYVGQFRSAQCDGADAVRGTADTTSRTFLYSAEYANRARTNAQYVSDLYNAILRRGADLQSLQYWIGQLDSGAQTREQLRVQFMQSPEFANRVANVVNAGCAQ